jgi:transcription initiation factor TFIIF subunit beta
VKYLTFSTVALYRKDVNGDPKIAVLLPAEPAPTPASNGLLPATDRKGKGRTSIIRRPTAVPTEYKLTLQNTATKNMFVFGEKEEDVKDTGVEGARKRRSESDHT